MGPRTAIEQPGELTTAEKLQVNAFLEAYTYLVLRDCYLVEREVFADLRPRHEVDAPFGHAGIHSSPLLAPLMNVPPMRSLGP